MFRSGFRSELRARRNSRVMYSIPLRRTLVPNSDLPYPYGCVARMCSSRSSGALRWHYVNREAVCSLCLGRFLRGFAVSFRRRFFAPLLRRPAASFGCAVSGYNFTLSFALLPSPPVCLSVELHLPWRLIVGGWLVPLRRPPGDLTTARQTRADHRSTKGGLSPGAMAWPRF